MKTAILTFALILVTATAFAQQVEPTTSVGPCVDPCVDLAADPDTDPIEPGIRVTAPVDVEVDISVEPTPVTVEAPVVNVAPADVTVLPLNFVDVSPTPIVVEAPTPWYEEPGVWVGGAAVIITAVVLGAVLSQDNGGHTTNIRSGFSF